MKKRRINTDKFTIRFGRIYSTRHLSKQGNYDYTEGFYMHPLGVVTFYHTEDVLTIRSSKNSKEYHRHIWDLPEISDRIVGNFCRQLLKEIQ